MIDLKQTPIEGETEIVSGNEYNLHAVNDKLRRGWRLVGVIQTVEKGCAVNQEWVNGCLVTKPISGTDKETTHTQFILVRERTAQIEELTAELDRLKIDVNTMHYARAEMEQQIDKLKKDKELLGAQTTQAQEARDLETNARHRLERSLTDLRQEHTKLKEALGSIKANEILGKKAP